MIGRLNPGSQERAGEGNLQMGAVFAACAGCHEVNGKGAALAIGLVGWRVMQCVAVMEHDPTGRQVDDGCTVYIHVIARVE